MELKNLQTFKTIIEQGSFTKAADKLNYIQSTITFQMQQLEQELSAVLFEKIGRRMSITKAGEALIPYVDEVLSSVEKMKGYGTELSKLKGDLHIFLKSMNCYEIRDALLAGSIDLGVFYQDIGGMGDPVISYPIGEYPLSLVASPNTKKQFSDFITPGQKLEIPFIIDEPDCIFRQIFENYLRGKNIKLNHTIELWSIPTIKNLVKNDLGVSYLPTFTVESELKSGELCEIKTELSNKTITAVCVHHKNKWISPLMQLFIDLVQQTEE